MRCAVFVAAVIVTAVCLTRLDGLSQDARQIGGVGLTVFADRNFRGRSATLREDTPDFRTIGLNDAVSSLRVASGEQWEVCEHINYAGRCIAVSGSESDLRRTRWDNIISSARRIGVGIRPPIGGIPPPIQPIPTGLELFANTGFSGDRRVFTTAAPDLRRVSFNDVARSLRIAPGQQWQVCADANYRNCLVVNTNWPDLNGLGMSRRISSVRPWQQGGGVGVGRAIVLFDDRAFRGRSFRVDRESPQLSEFANRAQSVQLVGGGSWQLCDRTSFRGHCVVVSGDLPDLASISLARRVASVRPAQAPR